MRSVLTHGILAVGGLVLAYLVWTDDGTTGDEAEVTVVDCTPGRLDRAELSLDDKRTILEPAGQGDDRMVWVTATRAIGSEQERTQEFVGSPDGLEYLGQLAPFRARRSLGELDDEQLGEVELGDEPAGRLTLGCGGRTEELLVGGRAFGSGDRYVRRASGGPVYLVASDRFQGMESPDLRLMQRQLHVFEDADVDRLTVTAEGQSQTLLHYNRRDPSRAEWVDEAAPTQRNELYGNWLASLGRLRVQSYLDRDQGPEAAEGVDGDPEPVLNVTYQGEDGELGTLELVRVRRGSSRAFYARTETTRSWVEVPESVGREAADNVRPVVGLDPVEEPEPEPDSAEPDSAEPDSAEPDSAEPEGGEGEESSGGAESQTPAEALAPEGDDEPAIQVRPGLPPGHP